MPYIRGMERLIHVHATPAQARALDFSTHAAWPCGLALEDHVEKEVRLRQGPWPRATLSAWSLHDTDDPARRALASCEVYAVPVEARGRQGRALAFASVFVEPVLRGHGYASRLLERLHADLGAAPDIAACVLFSDVGAAIYERLGYTALPAFDRLYPPQRAHTLPEGVLPVSESQVRALPLCPPTGAFALTPSHDQLDWHLDRSRLRAEYLGLPRPARCGAALASDPRQHIVWVDEEGELLVLSLVADTPEAARALVTAAQDTAARAVLSGVRAWETPGVVWPAGERVARDGCLPMIRPVWAGVEPAEWAWVPRALWV